MGEQLKNITILIGKDPNNSSLCLGIESLDAKLVATMGCNGSVPNTVSRCKSDEGKAHCKIVFDESGAMVIFNLKPQNVTYVNGVEIEKKRINLDSKIELGRERYNLDLLEVLNVVEQSLSEDYYEKHGYSITHLNKVWEDFHNQELSIKKKQKNIGLLRGIPILFTMLGGLITAMVGPEYRFIPLIFTMVALVIMIYGIYLSFTDKSIEKMEELRADFQELYVCPNKKCQHFMGNQPYNVVRKNKKCPYCKCKFIED